MLKLEMPTFEQVLEESGGNEQLLKKLLLKFRLWLKQQLHLPQDIPDRRLQFFIYAAKFDLEKAKKRFDSHYTLRNLVPEFYANRDPLGDDIIQCHTYIQWTVLPKLMPENYRISIGRFLHPDSSVFNIGIFLKYFFMILDTRVEEDIVNSDFFIFDCTNFRLGHALQYTPSILKKFDLCLESYGTRIKAIHVINAPSFFDIVMTIMKSVMRAKLINRVYIHTSGIESLYGIIPKPLLPANYDGEQPSMDNMTDMWRAKLAERREWFLAQEKITANESLRSNSIINPYDLFGVAGTFQKLDID